jgi:hypothetical protein
MKELNNSNLKYLVDGQHMDEYLRNRFIATTITFSIIAVVVLLMFSFILYKLQAPEGLWSFLISVPIITGAFLFGVKTWNNKLLKLSDTEFILTNNSLVQKAPNQAEKEFAFSEIAVVDKKKFGTTLIKGNWLTKIDYYRPKKVSYQLDDPKLIFIPSITTNYSELIDTLKQARRLT